MARRKDPTLTAGEEKAVIDWAGKVRIEVLACRQFGHSWTHGLTTLFRVRGDYIREVGCGRCGMRRRDVITAGEYGPARRNYLRPPDYARERGDGGSVRIPRWAVADAVVERSTASEPPQDLLDWYYKRGAE